MSELRENTNLFEVFVQGVAQRLTKKIDETLFKPFFSQWNKFLKESIKLSYSEAEAAELLGIAESTLAAIRNAGGINCYEITPRIHRYGLHHLQAYLNRCEKKVMPQPFYVLHELSAIAGVKTESRPVKTK